MEHIWQKKKGEFNISFVWDREAAHYRIIRLYMEVAKVIFRKREPLKDRKQEAYRVKVFIVSIRNLKLRQFTNHHSTSFPEVLTVALRPFCFVFNG